ncbi:dockerin type I repeat-containing protein, partial [Ruminococcus sp.]|uniref:dockerin type I repeat-containing protein n=1 Tax=Ruminococcus sp. TaxID=41978 RepID=UPI002E8070B7
IPSDFAVAKVEAYKLGDADGDGEVDITDATTIQRFDVRMNIAPVTEADLLARADVDGDGEITIIDATMIQRKLAGIIKIFPAEENNG